jgi:hypothetical protein
MIHSREPKGKREVEPPATVRFDTSEWRTQLPTLISRLSTEESGAAIRSLTYFFGTTFVGPEIEPLLTDLLTNLQALLRSSSGESDIQPVAVLLALIAVNIGPAFSSYMITVVTEFLPQLHSLDPARTSVISAIAIITSFAIGSEEEKVESLTTLLGLAHTIDLQDPPEILVAVIDSITLLVSSSPNEVVNPLLDDIKSIIRSGINSPAPEVVSSVLSLISATFDFLRGIDENIQAVADHLAPPFAAAFREHVLSAHRRLESSLAEAKSVRQKADGVLHEFDGEIVATTLTLKIQPVEFAGARALFLIKALKRLCSVYFEHHLTHNTVLHTFFGYRVLTPGQVRRLKKQFSWTIKKNRKQALKDRERDIEKKRDLKAKTGEDEDE